MSTIREERVFLHDSTTATSSLGWFATGTFRDSCLRYVENALYQ